MELEGIVTGLLLGASLLLLGFGLKTPIVGAAAALIVFLVTLLSTAAGFILFPLGACAQLFALDPSGKNRTGQREIGYCITAYAGPLAGRQYYLTERSPNLEFGRAADCQAQFPANTGGVSTHHCRLVLQNKKALLSDSGSRYGTYLLPLGRKLEPRVQIELADGSEFCLASSQIAFRINQVNL